MIFAMVSCGSARCGGVRFGCELGYEEEEGVEEASREGDERRSLGVALPGSNDTTGVVDCASLTASVVVVAAAVVSAVSVVVVVVCVGCVAVVSSSVVVVDGVVVVVVDIVIGAFAVDSVRAAGGVAVPSSVDDGVSWSRWSASS